MTATTAPERPDPTRTGAVWVTGTGAFLLLAAAAVFTAVRWDQIPNELKLAALGLCTGGFLLAGRRLAEHLPATAGALFHLGAFLVPVDVAAIGLGVEPGWHWSTILLAEGVAGVATFWWAARTEQSVVLRWSAGAAVVVLAGGVAATTALPAPLVLVACAVGALALKQDVAAAGWAAVVGVAPVFALTEPLSVPGAGTMADVGLDPSGRPVAAALAAVVAGGVLALLGRRHERVDQAFAGVLVAATGVAAAWFSTSPEPTHTVVGLAALFLLAELTMSVLRDDEFWSGPTLLVVLGFETVAVGSVVVLAGSAIGASALDATEPVGVVTSLLVAAGWAVAEARRRESTLPLASTAVAIPGIAAVVFATSSPIALGAALVTAAALAATADRRDAPVVALAGAVAAPLVVWGSHAAAVGILAMLGALTLGELAVRTSHRLAGDNATARAFEESAWILSITAVAPLLLAVAALAGRDDHVAAVLVGGAVAAALRAAWIDRGRTASSLPLGTVARLGVVAVLAGVEHLPMEEIVVVAGAVAALSVLDAVRLRAPAVALGASLATPIAIGAFVHWRGLSTASTGVALTVAAVVIAGLGSLLDRQWWLPAATAVGLTLGAGLLLASGEPAALAHAVIITGGVGMAASIVLGRTDALYAAGLVTTLGVWLRLAEGGVSSTEPYLVPVVSLLLLAGSRSRPEASSWVAYGPAVAVLGGAALLERMDGGSSWHALVAGSVGLVAVMAGGARRLAAPLLLGTALLVTLTGYETLDQTAGLPTWIWLAAGGTTLLAAGVAMERHDVGPIETGRRLVDVVNERFG